MASERGRTASERGRAASERARTASEWGRTAFRPQPPPEAPGMIVCGDDALAHRLGTELAEVYRVRTTVVVATDTALPGEGARERGFAGGGAAGRAAALLGRMTTAMARGTAAPANGQAGQGSSGPADASGHESQGGPGSREGVPRQGGGQRGAARPVPSAEAQVLVAPTVDDALLVRLGVEEASALALVFEDDELNIHTALRARRLNPRLRLVIRMYNRKLGSHLEEVLDQAAVLGDPSLDAEALDATTTVLSDADTAAPALAATAVAGTRKIVQADGLLLRAVERTPADQDESAGQGLCTLALLSSTAGDPAGSEGSDSSGTEGPLLLPDEETVARARGRAAVVLDTVAAPAARRSRPQRLVSLAAPISSLLSRRLNWSLAAILLLVVALGVAGWLTTGEHPLHAAYLSLLDLLAIGDPADGEPVSRQILQLLSGFVGLLLLPVLVAAVLEGLGTFRTAYALRRPPRGLSGHVVLLGLGKIGSRVLQRLRELDIPVVCVEEDPEARGVPLARRLRVPTVLGDVTEEGVLEAAKVHRAAALLALTSSDTTNLEAVLYARGVKPDLKVALRLYDDRFATAVYRTLRAAHPEGLTRSRSVTTLAAPAFASAMMGRQILGAMPVERRVLLFADLQAGAHHQLSERTVGQVFRPGVWRVLALDTEAEEAPSRTETPHGTAREPRLLWDPPAGYVLRPQDRVILAATRQGLAELLLDAGE
nr:NAD-binding protein [Streptomyces sp. SCSIO ZS0520]